MDNIHQTLEKYQLSSSSIAPPKPPIFLQTTPHQQHASRFRADSDVADPAVRREVQLDSESQASDIFENGQNGLPSRATSHASDSNGVYIGKSPQPDKAKQVMGLNPGKRLSSSQCKVLGDDGNIAALEKEYSDVFAPEPEEPLTGDTARENDDSMDEDRVKETARDIYSGTEILVAFSGAARWLMKDNEFNSRVRTAYMELYDFVGLDILAAVRYAFPLWLSNNRRLCSRLFLKGETQQLDRILESLAKRWYECNPENGMKDPGTSRMGLLSLTHRRCTCSFLLNFPSQHRPSYC
jgi:Sec7-like guanine-nucleotide exchange factor